MRSLNVLFAQDRLCMRAWNEAATLVQSGVRVSLLELSQSAPMKDYSIFARRVSIPVLPDIRSVVRNARRIRKAMRSVLEEGAFDIVHTHNEPDFFGAWAAGLASVPVVHDVHDIVTESPVTYSTTLRNKVIERLYASWEGRACRGAAAVLTVSPPMADYFRGKYGIPRVFAVENKATPRTIERLPKRRGAGGAAQVVYAGSLSLSGPERGFLGELVRLSDAGAPVHVYPAWVREEDRQAILDACHAHANLHYHDPVPPDRAVGEISQYDYGVIWSSDPQGVNARVSCPNKLHDYRLAGLSIITNLRGGWVGDYVAQHQCGLVVDSMDEAARKLPVPDSQSVEEGEHFMNAREILSVYEAVFPGPM